MDESMKAPPLAYTSLEKETSVDELPIEGQFPAWLSGMLIRRG
jgi:carotenoid cleavage dioxygenase-like enzyme